MQQFCSLLSRLIPYSDGMQKKFHEDELSNVQICQEFVLISIRGKCSPRGLPTVLVNADIEKHNVHI
jgi:hypothetical protein